MGKYIANKNPLQHSNHSAQHNIIFVDVCCTKPLTEEKAWHITTFLVSAGTCTGGASLEGRRAVLKQKAATESNTKNRADDTDMRRGCGVVGETWTATHNLVREDLLCCD